MLKGEKLLRASKGLHLVNEDGDTGFSATAHKRFEVGCITDVETTFPLNQFKEHASMLPWMPFQVCFQRLQGSRRAALWINRIIEGHIIHRQVFWQPLTK